ncbi:aldolase/citrate lyase family protein [Blastopirellula sp. JC732]|uniref:Aldolase/citrate lyase family protein n=1 Tax=Blastopirellula sediminis TaxID=2894196 RepID=A0A9X1MPW6_9BACT|nr:aldolase/citrate lyase family protein [Blastopirellula sediminis]MCC9605537.1 aldolase/citrate lyase family protein [Blastopirellula sediminis]MCC9631163.1 aldolase/citrate lyase family protein [Blastopirellula sediminis]
MRRSKVLAKVRNDVPAFGTALHLNSPDVYEMAGLMGFDAIWLDMEHHATTVESAANLIRAARAGGADVVARPAKGEYMRLGRMLEAGASGIMYPRCCSAEEAAEVVQWMKFAPLGKRGCDASGPDVPYMLTPLTEYLTAANEETFLIIQLEDPESLQHVDAIAAVPGVDMLMLGPGDFSILSGIPGQFDHPLVLEAQEKVIQAALNAGKTWAATCGSVAQAKAFADRGARMLFHGCDIVCVKQGLEKIKNEMAQALNQPIPGILGNGAAKHYQETR